MRSAKLFSGLFGLLGAVLMAAALVLCWNTVGTEVPVNKIPPEAGQCAEALLAALAAGDGSRAGELLYGGPELASETEEEPQAMLREAFAESLTYEFAGLCYLDGDAVCRDVTVTALDLAAVMEAVADNARSLAEELEGAEDPSLYDENNELREDVAAQVLNQAAQAALQETANTRTWELTLRLYCRNGNWQVVPDAALMGIISGGMA